MLEEGCLDDVSSDGILATKVSNILTSAPYRVLNNVALLFDSVIIAKDEIQKAALLSWQMMPVKLLQSSRDQLTPSY